MADVATLNTDISNARAAILAEDWALARKHLLMAKAAIASIPDGRQDGTDLRFRGKEIDELIKFVVEEQSAAAASSVTSETGPVQRTSLEFT